MVTAIGNVIYLYNVTTYYASAVMAHSLYEKLVDYSKINYKCDQKCLNVASFS